MNSVGNLHSRALAIEVLLIVLAMGGPLIVLAADSGPALKADASTVRARFEHFTCMPLRVGIRIEPTLVPRY